MVGINNNNYVGQVPPTFGPASSSTDTNTQSGPLNPFSSGDSYSVDNTSKAFDEAMAKLTGKSVLPPQNNQVNTAPAGVSQEEMTWAMALEKKVQAENYTPNAQETAAYQAIAAKMSAAQSNPVQQTSSGGATQEEVAWALALEQKVKNEKYQPNTQETAAYQAIAAKLAASKSPAAQTNNVQTAGATQEEIKWALDLEAKAKAGYQPNAQETAAYQAIAAKMAAAKNNSAAPVTNSPGANVSQEEVQWALDIESKYKTGYQPNAQETAKYQDIAKRLAASKSQPQQQSSQAATVGQDEVKWALDLEEKAKSGYQPNPAETAKYQDIAHRLQTSQQGNPSANSNNKDWAAWSQPFSVPKTLFQTTPRIIQVPASLRSAVPTLPTYAVANVGPSLTSAGNTNNTAGNNQGVNQNEINWALDLEKKVKTGYSPNESELYQYKNIADRLQATKGTGTQASSNLPQTNNKPAGTQPAGKGGLGDRIKNAWSALTK